MSTNKTPNYNLHAWEPADDFLRSEFNENFAAIDDLCGRKATLVTGTYKGNNETSQTIDLGLPILALIVENPMGLRQSYSNNNIYGGLALAGVRSQIGCAINGTAFTARLENSFVMNGNNITYSYLAWVDDGAAG